MAEVRERIVRAKGDRLKKKRREWKERRARDLFQVRPTTKDPPCRAAMHVKSRELKRPAVEPPRSKRAQPGIVVLPLLAYPFEVFHLAAPGFPGST
ncbi:hypothetical protein TNCV_2506141 [Trichonephila clavipes]|uniref:Uncharacterized protein n=1 Tax=Trichonephila clavipes TaxID=2585209 RepID=A0A8X6WHM4_TRICX|nr:hypothetical protein TNCV_2506141 [Trichonephila clavipes]